MKAETMRRTRSNKKANDQPKREKVSVRPSFLPSSYNRSMVVVGVVPQVDLVNLAKVVVMHAWSSKKSRENGMAKKEDEDRKIVPYAMNYYYDTGINHKSN